MKAYAGEQQTRIPLNIILLAGLCGGVAEVLWFEVYGSHTAISSAEVARQVTVSVFPAAANLAWAPALGVTIHLVLSLALGVVFARMIWIPVVRNFDVIGTLSCAIAALIAVWAFNFFIVLPVLNPNFTTLMPLSVTFVSKALFGVAMAAVLQKSAGKLDCGTVAVHAA